MIDLAAASLLCAGIALAAAAYAHRCLHRVLDIEDAIYKRLDQEFVVPPTDEGSAS
jgi:hypothetical protein